MIHFTCPTTLSRLLYVPSLCVVWPKLIRTEVLLVAHNSLDQVFISIIPAHEYLHISMSSTKVNVLSAQSADLDVVLPQIISFSNVIFSADPNTKYASITHWKERLSHPSSVIIYLTPTDGGGDTILPIGFLFAHPRTHTPALYSGHTETLHIWLAGVSPEWRKAGCMQRMVDAVLHPSSGDPTTSGFAFLTVCTTPERFPDMWKWLLKRGWNVERDMGADKILLSKAVTV